ncbi:MAG TPA: peptidylprolyl isomerase [Mycobacteriales bacterium]|nr:peptidylprolyl isomerase [Mycobacteriales bacterium]
MRHAALAALAAGAALVLAGCGSSSSGGASAEVTTSNPPASTVTPGTAPSGQNNANGCTTVPTARPRDLQFNAEPKLTVAKSTYTATIVTNCGTIVVSLDGKHAPHTVNSFAFLAGKGYFDDTPCHRLTTSDIFVLQCGDPTGTGSGGPGYAFKDEYLNDPALGKPDATDTVTYPAGIVAMANSGPNTNGSQFFLVYKDSPLGPNYTPFGRITAGLDVVDRIAAAGSNPQGDGAPVQPVVIESFKVKKG